MITELIILVFILFLLACRLGKLLKRRTEEQENGELKRKKYLEELNRITKN